MDNIFAERLDRLFKEKRKPDGMPYSTADVLATTEGVLTRVHLWKLRNGRASNPSLKVIQALASCFDVSPTYFFEDEQMPTPCAPDSQVRNFVTVLRESSLGEEEQKAVLSVVTVLLKH
ncbi:MAG: helix-turn-helix domain-containing protein [Anaerolineales bacterium]